MKDFEFFKLEDRVLFEAAAAAEIVEAAEAAQFDPNADVSESDRQAQDERNALKNAPPENPAAAAESVRNDDPADIADVDSEIDALIDGEIPAGGVDDEPGKELVVIDSAVMDKASVIESLKPHQEVLILDDGTGLAELNGFLDNSDTEYSAIHLVTHGNKGYITINGEVVNEKNFDSGAWQQIGEHLTEDGDILLYGCETAGNKTGENLVDMISDASGADVAASNDTTGIAGNWVMEYASGRVEADEIEVAGYSYNLTNRLVTTAEDIVDDTDSVTSLREALAEAVDGDSISFDSSIDGQIIKLNSTLKIEDAVTITGNGTDKTVIDGQDSCGIFEYANLYFDDDVEISISGMTLQNGSQLSTYSTEKTDSFGGGAISVNLLYYGGVSGGDSSENGQFTLDLDNVTIADSKAHQGGGVAIMSYDVDIVLNIRNSTLYGNNAVVSTVGNGGDGGDGGAVYVSGTEFEINVINSTITGNSDASSYGYTGGGIFAKADNDSEMNIVNSIVFGNYHVDPYGNMAGGSDIYSVSESSDISITNHMIHSIYGVTLEGSAPDEAEWNVAAADGSMELDFTADNLTRVFGTDTPALDGNNVISVNNADIAGYSGTLAGYDADGDLVYMDTEDGSWQKMDGSAVSGTVTAMVADQLGNARDNVKNYLGINEFFVGAVAGKALIKVTGTDASYKYDGAAKDLALTYRTAGGSVVSSAGKLAITADGVNSADVAADGVGRNVGKYDFLAKDITVSMSYDSADVTGNFEFSGANVPSGADAEVADAKIGTIEITKRQVTLTSATDSKVYDGTALTNDQVTIGGDGFVSGEGASFDVTGSQLYVGFSNNTFTYTFDSATDAGNYDIITTEGVLTVTRAAIAVTITSDGAVKFYDGTELTESGYSSSGILNTDLLSVTMTGSQLNAGTSGNTFEYTITNNGVDVSENYAVITIYGALTVNKRQVVITADSASKVYDGTALTADGYSYSAFDAAAGTGFVDGEGLESVTVAGSQLNAGSSDNVITAYTLKSNTLAGNYDIDVVKGTLSVDQRQITITVDPGQSMTYGDTSPGLEYQVGGYGMAGSEVLNGSLQLDATSSDYSTSGNLKADTYEIIQGTLTDANNPNYKIVSFTGEQFTVNQKEISVTQITVDDKTYDGNTDATLSGGVISGTVSGDDIAVNWDNADANFASPDAGDDIPVTLTGGLSLYGADSGNYKLPDSYRVDGSGNIDPKDVTVHFVSDSPYLYDSTDQSAKVSAYYVDINGNKIDLPINWNGKIFAAAGDYVISVTITDSNYHALNTTATVTILPFNPAGGDYADGVNNSNYAAVVPSIQGGLTAGGIGGDNVYTMNYPQLVSLSMLNYGRGMMDQNELIRGDGPADISVTSQVDILEYKPMTLDSIMRESSVFEVSGTVAPQGVVSGQEIFTSAGDTLIEVRGDAPVETPESLYIDNDDTAETLPWSALPEAFELQSKADNFKSDFEKVLEEMLLA